MAQIILDESAAPSTPAAGKVTFYAKTDGLPYSKDDAGTETALGGAPASADFLVKTANAALSGERVVTDGTSITADFAVAGQVTFKRAALTGDVTASADANATTIAAGAVTEAKQTLADNTTNDVTSTKHGYAPKALADATKFLNSDTTPAYALVKDSDLSTSDITTNNASTTKHGFSPKATAPAAGLLSVLAIGNLETVRTDQALFDTTNPAALGAVGPGTALVAARRDHVHANPAIDTLAAATDITTLNASSTAHGLLPKLSNISTEFLNGQGAFATPVGGGGMQELIFTAQANQPPASAYATPDTRNSHPVLDFDGSTDEEAVFGAVLPTTYAGGGLTVEIWVAFTSATSGSAHFQAAIERIDVSSLDIDADSFAALNESDAITAPGTNGQVIKTTVTFTNGADMDSLAAGEAFRLKIRRDADGTGGTDDITTDAEVLRVVLRET